MNRIVKIFVEVNDGYTAQKTFDLQQDLLRVRREKELLRAKYNDKKAKLSTEEDRIREQISDLKEK